MRREAIKHRGTGRPCVILPPTKLADTQPFSHQGDKYVLVIASASDNAGLSVEQARAWLDAGAAYICAWGPHASQVEESFDYASFLPELGEPLPFALMTTSHESESLAEALWFAFWNSAPPDDLASDLQLVVVQPGSASLEQQVSSWVQSNAE